MSAVGNKTPEVIECAPHSFGHGYFGEVIAWFLLHTSNLSFVLPLIPCSPPFLTSEGFECSNTDLIKALMPKITGDHCESLSQEPIFRPLLTPPLTVGAFAAICLPLMAGNETHNERNTSLIPFGASETSENTILLQHLCKTIQLLITRLKLSTKQINQEIKAKLVKFKQINETRTQAGLQVDKQPEINRLALYCSSIW